MIRLSNERIDSSDSFGSAVLEKDPEVKEPALYQVVLINDDYTPMEFVVYVLQTVFSHTHEQSTQIMMAVHTKGKGERLLASHQLDVVTISGLIKSSH
jgi:ATP-dependent Clp protease adaptor protein ClpS